MEAIINIDEPQTIKNYFEKVFQLQRSGEEFPVNLDDVWPMVYTRKDHAVRELLNNERFIKGIDYEVFLKNGENYKGGRPSESYSISVSCLEYFVARKERSVFEVYRQVFHKAVKQTFFPDFTNPAESARAWATQFEEKQAALQLVDVKEKEIQELWPKAKATEELLESHDSISIGDFAKAINYGQNKLFEVLRNDKILIDSGSKYNQPYQSYIDRGYFELQELTKLIKDQRKIFFQTRVTPKGQVYLIKHIESKKAS